MPQARKSSFRVVVGMVIGYETGTTIHLWTKTNVKHQGDVPVVGSLPGTVALLKQAQRDKQQLGQSVWISSGWDITVLQIRRGKRDNLGINFHITLLKHRL